MTKQKEIEIEKIQAKVRKLTKELKKVVDITNNKELIEVILKNSKRAYIRYYEDSLPKEERKKNIKKKDLKESINKKEYSFKISRLGNHVYPRMYEIYEEKESVTEDHCIYIFLPKKCEALDRVVEYITKLGHKDCLH